MPPDTTGPLIVIRGGRLQSHGDTCNTHSEYMSMCMSMSMCSGTCVLPFALRADLLSMLDAVAIWQSPDVRTVRVARAGAVALRPHTVLASRLQPAVR